MHKYTLLIADASEEFCESMRLEACDQYHVHCCSSGSDAQNLLRTLCPDVLILDLMLPFVDGITLLQQAQQEGIRPITLVTTALVNDYVNRRLEELEVSFLIRKPCNVHAVMQHLLELTHIPAPFQTVSDHSAAMLRVLLLPLCVNPKRKGYTSLLDAILMVKDDPDASFTKEIYPALAAASRTTARCEERRIRLVIEDAWKNRNEEIWLQYFPADSTGTLTRPSNAAFITRMAEVLRSS